MVREALGMTGTEQRAKSTQWRVTVAGGLVALMLSLASLSLVAPTPAHASEPRLVASYAFDENSGRTAHDDTGDHHDGTVESSEWEAGKFGSALKFDGTDDCVSAPGTSDLQMQREFTLEAWVMPEGSSEGEPVIFKETAGFASYGLYLTEGDHPEGIISPGGTELKTLKGPTALPRNAWSDIALTFDGTTMRLYVNDSLVATGSSTPPVASEEPLHIGCSKDWAKYFAGRIDNVRIYDRALSVGELGEDEAAPVKPLPPRGPVASYSFEEQSSGLLTDDTGNEHEGTFEGTAYLRHGGKYGKNAGAFPSEGNPCITIADSPSLQLTGEFTLESWVYPEGARAGEPLLFKETESWLSYGLYLSGGDYPEGVLAPKVGERAAQKGPGQVPLFTWSFLSLTYNGERMALYANGELVGTRSVTTPIASNRALHIGCSKLWGEYFTGRIDNVRVYSRALNSSELAEDQVTEVHDWAPSTSKVTAPVNGTRTAGWLKLKSAWSGTGVTEITYQYREGVSGVFKTIPAELVRNSKGQIVSWPVPVNTVGESEPLYFDVAGASPKLRKEGGPVQVRAVFGGIASQSGPSVPVEAKVSRALGGPGDSTAAVGPGHVDLLTGNFTFGRTDVSIPAISSALEFNRTYNSRGPGLGQATNILGPGWSSGTPIEEEGGSAWKSVKIVNYGEEFEGVVYNYTYAVVSTVEGGELSFEKVGESYVAPPEMSGWQLRQSEGKLYLTEPAGTITTFEESGVPGEYVPVSFTQTNSGKTVLVYKLMGGQKRLTAVIAPPQADIVCATEAEAMTIKGCRSLVFTYQTPSELGIPAADGERLTKITYYAPGIGAGSAEVARYRYDSEGRLIEEWDPRFSPTLPETYAYGPENQLKEITPAGQMPWEMEYGAFEEEGGGGRLLAVRRASLVSSPSTAQTTIAYGTPISGSGAPYDLSAHEVASWGQADVPVAATAIFPPSEVPASPPSSYAKATVYYMDANGYTVNLATPKGAGTSEPSISTTEYDEYGNVVRELTPDNRLRALAAGAGTVGRSHELETKWRFSADGTQMEEEWGPTHEIRLASGSLAQGRFHKVVSYNEGWREKGVNPHLPTKETAGALVGAEFLEQRVTETHYNWKLDLPTETIIDPGTGHLNIEHITVYDETTGLPVETRQPSNPEGGRAGSTQTVYYHAGEKGLPCEKTVYAGLPCEIKPAAQASGTGRPELPVKRFAAYNQLGEPTQITESPGGGSGNVRKTILTYDAAGRQVTKQIEGGGEAVPESETTYSSTLGLPEHQRFVCSEGPCPVEGLLYASSLGSSGPGEGQLSSPSDVALDSSGNVWVLDQGNNRIEKFSPSGAYLQSVGSAGSGNGQFRRPTALAIDSSGNLWVTDSGNARVEEFDSSGAFVRKFGSPGSGNGQFALGGPEGIAIDHEGDVWVSDTYGGRIEEFSATGEYLKTIASKGSGPGQLEEPMGIAFAPSGNAWVIDWATDRVLEFSQAGGFIRQVGSKGSGEGQFNGPAGIDVDAAGNIYVSDQGSARVERLSAAGKYLSQFGSRGSGSGQFKVPTGIATGSGGQVWVVDSSKPRVPAQPTSRAGVIAAYSFDEGEGTVAHDFSGHGHDAEIKGAEWTTGKYGKALNFNAAEGDELTVPDSEDLRLRDFTLEAWVQPEESREEAPVIAKTDPEGYGYALYAGVEGAAGHPQGFNTYHEWVEGYVYSGEELPTHKWSHIAVTSDGKELRLYVNGVLVDERAASEIEAGEGPLQIGGDEPFAHGGYFDGKIDEVRVYGRALSTEEIREDKKTGIQTPPARGPVAAYSFDEGEGTVAHDFSGHGHDAEIKGAEWTTGKYGKALNFNAAEGDELTVPNSEDLRLHDFTLEAWVEPAESREEAPVIAKTDPEGYGYALYAGVEGAPGHPQGFNTYHESVEGYAYSGEELPTHKWSHIAVTSDGKHLRLYINGVLVDEREAQDIEAGEGPLQIGGDEPFAHGGYFDGKIDEVRVYGRALNGEELSEDGEEPVRGAHDVVQQWTSAGSFNHQETSVSYDSLGRPVEYEDADGNVAKTTYDLEGRPIATSDARGSQTYHYDPTSGLLTELTDSGAGTFTAKYDADGNLIERTLPNGLTATTTYNAADEPVHLTYTKAASCGTSCTWFDEGLERAASGQILAKTGTLSSEQYKYDQAGRLTLAEETPTGGSCTTRSYGYEADSNRTEMVTRSGGIGGVCNTESGGAAQKYSYDAADRLEGPTYDAWGRITSLPGEFAGGKTLTTSYFSNEMVATQTQNGVSNAFQLDAMGRQRQRVQASGLEGTEVFHYDGPGDSLAWTERAGTWTRSIGCFGGELCATQESSSGVTFDLTDLHGNVVATASPNSSETKLLSTSQYDEFGDPVSGGAGRFGWLGGKQRRTELSSGVIQMGARSYIPQLGRFISIDPVRGGSSNAYDYANADPVNGLDLGGKSPACQIAEPRLTAKNRASRTGTFTLKTKAWARCSKAARNVHVKAVILGGGYSPAPGVNVSIPSQRGPSVACGNGGVKFDCEIPAQVTFEATPNCGEAWPGELEAIFFVFWETRNGTVIEEQTRRRFRFNVVNGGEECG